MTIHKISGHTLRTAALKRPHQQSIGDSQRVRLFVLRNTFQNLKLIIAVTTQEKVPPLKVLTALAMTSSSGFTC